jgi:hemerythrin
MFEWKEEYSVNVKEIDDQHKHFFEIISNVYTLKEQPSLTLEDLRGSVEELRDYALFHLSTEEFYFDKFNFDGAAEHVEVHNAFRRRIGDLIGTIEDKGADPKILVESIARFCGEWLANHILEMDRLYIDCFVKNGMK